MPVMPRHYANIWPEYTEEGEESKIFAPAQLRTTQAGIRLLHRLLATSDVKIDELALRNELLAATSNALAVVFEWD